MPGHSIVWIGSAKSWAESGLAENVQIDVTWARDAKEAAGLRPERFDAAILVDEPNSDATLGVRTLRRRAGCPPLLVWTHDAPAERLRSFLSAGAQDVLLLPSTAAGLAEGRATAAGSADASAALAAAELIARLERIARARRPLRARSHAGSGETHRAHARSSAPDDQPLPGVIVRSRAMHEALTLAGRAAGSNATVLVSGETGSGKEIVARAVHTLGPRRKRPFVAVNCAAFPDTLLESELFGHVRGSFTGAERDRRGLFEEADGGTLFLDEVGETSRPFQAKLLRVLQEREVRPIGGGRARPIDVRVVVATNRNLREEAARGDFREDLYYRLAVFPIGVPPLRERPQDVIPLAEHFLASYGERELKPGCALSRAAQHLLLAHDWPGNVREIENEMQRALALVDAGEPIGPAHLSPRIARAAEPVAAAQVDSADRDAPETLRESLARVEALLIRRTLERNHGRRAVSARELGITREGLHKKMKRLGIE